MEHRKLGPIDAYGFPDDLIGHPLLAWMGSDYVRHVADALLARFRDQDHATTLLALLCAGRPRIETRVDSLTGSIQAITAEFSLQVLLRNAKAECWRLQGDALFRITGLDQPAQPPVTDVGFEIRATEKVA